MSTDNMKKPTGDANHPAGSTDRASVCDAPATNKEFATLRARAAMRGHELHRSNPADGPARYWASRCGMTKELRTLQDVHDFLRQIGSIG